MKLSTTALAVVFAAAAATTFSTVSGVLIHDEDEVSEERQAPPSYIIVFLMKPAWIVPTSLQRVSAIGNGQAAYLAIRVSDLRFQSSRDLTFKMGGKP